MNKSFVFDSNEELEFSYWLEELRELGYIKNWYKNTTSELILDKKSISFKEKLKTKTKTKNLFILHDLQYTFDFYIEWETIAEGIFFIKEDNIYNSNLISLDKFIVLKSYKNNETYVDIKGVFGGGNSAITFPIIQKLFYENKKIFVQKIIPKKLFTKTFLPKKLAFKKNGDKRVIATKTIDIETYIQKYNNG